MHPENDNSKYLVDDATSGIRLESAPTTETIPNKYLWSISSASGGGKLIKNSGTGRYISQSSANELTTVTATGTSGSATYNKCVWRLAASADYKELSNFTITTKIMVDVNQTKAISFSKSPTNATWCDPADFSYSFSSGTSGATSVDSSTGKVKGQKCGIATYTVTHKVTGRSKTVKIYVDSFTERLANHFGFADNAATLIREVYARVDKYNPSESVQKRAYLASRALSAFDYCDFKFNALAGTGLERTNASNLEDFFTKVLGFNSAEFSMLRTEIKRQHTGKLPDFAHEQYALATRLAYITNMGIFSGYNIPTTIFGVVLAGMTAEKISYWGGWLGDATLPANGITGTTSLKNDDYCADLDAENVFRLIERGHGNVDIVSAYKTYHASLTASNTRAVIFKTNISYATVEHLVYVRLLNGHHFTPAIFESSHDTYNFLRSLEDGLAELRDYPDLPSYPYDFAPNPESQAFRHTENYVLDK